MTKDKFEKFFVALTFRSDSALSRKIINFRTRFDPNFNLHSLPHMSMLAPFEVEAREEASLKETLSEELESFFYGESLHPKMGFKGVDIWRSNRKCLLYLNPNLSTDMEYCMELVRSICEGYIPASVKYTPNQKQFLPLGKFQSEEALLTVMDSVREEFSSNSELPITGITLFKKKHGIWQQEENLISFEGTKDQFLQFHSASL